MEPSDGRDAPGPTGRPVRKSPLASVSRIQSAPYLKCKGSQCKLTHAKAHLQELLERGEISIGVPFECKQIRTDDQVARIQKSKEERLKNPAREHFMVLEESGVLREATTSERLETRGLSNRRSVGASPSGKFSRHDLARSGEGVRPLINDEPETIALAVGGCSFGDPTYTMEGAATVDHRLATQVAGSDPLLQEIFADRNERLRNAIDGRVAIGNYRLVEVVGQGNSGIVVKVLNEDDGQHYAMKFTWGTMVEGPKGDPDRFRVLRSYHIMSLLRTRHAARVFELLKHRTLGVITIEQLLSGKTLEDLLREGNGCLDLPEVKRITLALAQVLEEAHGHGYVHRDIKPENIMILEDGTIILVDWGIARSKTDLQRDNRSIMQAEYGDMAHIEGGATSDGDVIGTPHFMAPEQLDGGRITPQTDIYQLGATLFRLLTGRTVFANMPVAQLFEAIKIKPPVSARLFLPSDDEHRAFSNLLDDMLEKDPQSRPQSMADIMRRLDDTFMEPQQAVASHGIKTWVNTILLVAVLIVLILILLNLRG